MANIAEVIKQAALDAVVQSKPVVLAYGRVISAEPLRIRLDQKLELTAAHLVMTRAVTDHQVELTTPGGTVQSYTVHGGLQADEVVLMLRMQGGQKYLVLDRLGK